MHLLVVTPVLFTSRTLVAQHEDGALSAFNDFKATFGKAYADPAEEIHRRANFAQSLREVGEINAKGGRWTAALNEFSDLSWDEFKASVLMIPQNCSATHRSTRRARDPDSARSVPPSIDWRDYGALNAVKNQGHCGSCWTFSTIGTLESHVYLKYGTMLNLSEQELVDCAGAYNNHGCSGGLPSQAYEYLMAAGGVESEKSYPYTAKDGTCAFDPAAVVAKVRGVVNITTYKESEIVDAVGSLGPVSIAFDVASDFRHYAGGVYDGDCATDPMHVNHAVVAVGYGTDDEGNDYFTVRNSWGEGWGEKGYFKIQRGVNKCGLADCASYPVV